MTSNELKSLVKEYFNLTEVKFGEIFDENRAFKVVFEGETLELGMPVTVETTDGQKMDAPDGFHKLEGGMIIKTEDSKVVEITSTAEMAEEEETMEGGKKIADVKMIEVEKPDVVEEFPVEVQRGKEYELKKKKMMAEEEVIEDAIEAAEEEVKEVIEDALEETVEEVIKAIAEELVGQLEEMKKEMALMKEKMAKFAAEPAAEKTLPATKKFSLEVNATNPVQAERYEMMKNIIKTKKSK
jgi:hypothetical protein